MATTPTAGTAAAPEQPLTPQEAAAQKASPAEKKQILREAVSWYLRNDFRDDTVRGVCEEFIAAMDASAAAAQTNTSASSTQP